MPRYDTISFLSDYGTRDEFVGVVKSVMRAISPHAAVVDITHEVSQYDVRAGSLTLMRSAQYLCPGVVLAIVDPGVGTNRRAVAVEVGDGESVLVGPDNGLLGPVAAIVGGSRRAVELTNVKYQLASDSATSVTFAGRDVFAPAAAHLCNGVELSELGPRIDPATLQPALIPFSALEGDRLEADVLWIDRFGNVQLNVTPEQLTQLGEAVQVECHGKSFFARRARTFADLSGAAVGLLIDASGLAALVMNEQPASDHLGLAERDSVTLKSAG